MKVSHNIEPEEHCKPDQKPDLSHYIAQTLTNTSTKGSASTVMEKTCDDVLNINDHTWHKSKTTHNDQLLLLFNLRMRFSLPIKALTFLN